MTIHHVNRGYFAQQLVRCYDQQHLYRRVKIAKKWPYRGIKKYHAEFLPIDSLNVIE